MLRKNMGEIPEMPDYGFERGLAPDLELSDINCAGSSLTCLKGRRISTDIEGNEKRATGPP
jgi:hypothetical protein